MKTINLIELFAGYGSQALALKKLGIPYKVVAWCEFDPESKRPIEQQPAVVAHNLLHEEASDKNLGDVTKVDWVEWRKQNPIEIDLLTYSSPCQSISQAGLQHGFTEGSGTRSSLLWNVQDAILALQPRYLMQENVAAIVSSKFKPTFDLWCNRVEELGYTNYWTLLNAKDFGVPQNRKRLFMISVRNDIGRDTFQFPRPFKLETCLADVLEEDVENSFFLQDHMVERFLSSNEQEDDEMIYVTTDKFLTPEEVENIISEKS